MGEKRPTFSEHWFRVAQLKPRLMPSASIKKQYFRGQHWVVIQAPLNAEYFRLHAAAYGFIALLDGKRTVEEAWELSNRQFGDAAPTQGEAIQLMGRLYQSNLLKSDLPPDSAELLKRFKQRRTREMKQLASSVLFPKFPLFDPNNFLGRWLPLFSWIYSPIGLCIFMAAVIAGLASIAGRYGELWNSASGVLSSGNLPWLYLSFICSKLAHELGAAFASKHFGRIEGDAGQVRQAGIMLLLLAPAPFIDTSGIWGLRQKSHRILATASGFLSEFTLAALAAIVWANSSSGSLAHAVSYNLMFVASVSAFLFNGNPLLRFDAYYILCDLLETPNLGTRAQQYLYYLVKRYVWKLSEANSPAHTRGERIMFFIYGVAAGLYRLLLVSMILLTVADLAFFLGVFLAIVFAVMWFIVPLGKLVRYLFISGELYKVRNRALITTGAFTFVAVGGILLVPVPDRFRLEGVAEAPQFVSVYTKTEGNIEFIQANLSRLSSDDLLLLKLDNPWIVTEQKRLEAQKREFAAQLRKAESLDPAEAQSWRGQLTALESELKRVNAQVEGLNMKSLVIGTWFSPDSSLVPGQFVQHGQLVGQIIPDDGLIVRAVIGQDEAASLLEQINEQVEIRVKGRADLELTGEILSIKPAGKKELPSPAMGIPAGGEIQVDQEDQQGLTSQEHFFEIEVRPIQTKDWSVYHGQILLLRFSTSPKPLWDQGKRSLKQLFQRRFSI